MGTRERDEYLVGSLVNGLPTCIFSPKPYPRIITAIVLGNSVSSTVYCYRGVLGSTPVAQNAVGELNTFRDRIPIAAGQIFFVQWTSLGASVRDAYARVSWERDDGFLGSSAGSDSGNGWDTQPVVTKGNSHLTFIPAGTITVNVGVQTNIVNAVIPFNKRSVGTCIQTDLHVTAFTDVANAGLVFGTDIIDNGGIIVQSLLNAQISEVNNLFFAHTQFSGTNKSFSGIAIGNYTIQVWWARISGGGVGTMNVDDRLTMAVSEVEAF